MPTTESTASQSTPNTLGFAPPPLDPDESLGLLLVARGCPPAFPGATAHRFELNSRGDRVAGRLLLPEERSGPCPLVMIQAGAGASCDSPDLDFAGGWVRAGFAVATIDLALHGERSSPKFSERLLEAIENAHSIRTSSDQLDANGKSLLVEFTHQSIYDLSRTLDALATLPAIDDLRVGVMGLGHGATLAAIFASLDSRIGAVVLAHCSVIGLPEIDPVQCVPTIGPRPILLLESSGQSGDTDDEPNAALFSACAEPKFRDTFEAENRSVGAAAAEAARAFFADHLIVH